jgi:hypothetical protein
MEVDPASGTPVVAGAELTYTLTFTNDGTAAGDVDKVDDLTHVLDDADLIDGPTPSDDALTVTGPDGDNRIHVTGTLEPGDTVTVTYTIRVREPEDRGDDVLANFLLEPDEETPEDPDDCEPAEDELPDCTRNPIGDIQPDKSVDPESGTVVQAGDELTYTLTFENTGRGAADVDYVDHLAGVLDDAELISGPTPSDDALTATGPDGDGRIHVTGTVDAGETVTVTYTVRVLPDGERGDNQLGNFLVEDGVVPPEECLETNPLCTENLIPEINDWKEVDPASGTPVTAGSELTYTLTFTNDGKAAGDVDRVDDLTHVLDDADLIDGPTVSDDALSVDGPDGEQRFHITGTLGAGETVTVTYTVQVKPYDQQGDGLLVNFLTQEGQEPPAECVDTNPLCTQNPVEEPPADDPPADDPPADPPADDDGPSLPDTGTMVRMLALLAGIALVIGAVALVSSHRRKAAMSQGVSDTDDLA